MNSYALSLAALSLLNAGVASAHTSCEPWLMAPSQKLVFQGVNGRDVYNPTKPFKITFKSRELIVMAARVEARDSEQSHVKFFTETAGVWSPLVDDDAPEFAMQDPFFTFINGELIFGGVEIWPKAGGGYGYKTVFFRGKNLEDLNPSRPYRQGPAGMKDIRLVGLRDGRIGLFTRPQGMIPGTQIDAGPGRIGFKIINSLDELSPENITNTPLIENQFHGAEWGGANEAQLLEDGTIAVLIHVAHFDAAGNRHYYAAVFTMDPVTGAPSPIEIILKREQLTGGLNGISKRPDLVDVVFSGGMILDGDHVILYVGAGDAEVHVIKLKSWLRNR